MIAYLIPLLSSYLPLFSYVLWLCFAMVFVASVPNMIRRFIDFV